ncbi:MAG: SDR family oxidoreductase [Bacteroidales bacterium]|nr:SDR family oxidoreductase [Bacteroidales bacterium]
MHRTILITGATSGIGRACAIKFAGDNDRLILTGRRADRLNELAESLQKEFGVEVLSLNFDVRDKEAVKRHLGGLQGKWASIDILINNAGLAAGFDSIQEGSTDDWDQMIDTNVKGLLYVSRMIAPLMIKQGRGHIINVGSIAGKMVYPKGGVYCATKFAVDAITQSMRVDLLADGIKVSQVCPGAVETEFSVVRYKGNKEKADGVYKGFQPLTAEDIAGSIYWIAGLPAHVNINDLVVMPVAQASPAYFNKKL